MKWILVAIIVIIALIVVTYAYYGGFKKVNFQTSKQGGEMLVYEEVTGDYKQSGPVMDKVYYSLLNEDKIETFKGFGIYYDNPQKVETSKLRSEVGCILENSDTARITELTAKYKVKTYPKQSYLTTEFPYKGKLSVLVGVMRVYPAMNKYITEQGMSEKGAVMEIYDIPNKKILYRKEIVEE